MLRMVLSVVRLVERTHRVGGERSRRSRRRGRVALLVGRERIVKQVLIWRRTARPLVILSRRVQIQLGFSVAISHERCQLFNCHWSEYVSDVNISLHIHVHVHVHVHVILYEIYKYMLYNLPGPEVDYALSAAECPVADAAWHPDNRS